jgi:hypothetical protein
VDDTDDKVRRNLVVASAVVWAITVLEVRMANVATKYLAGGESGAPIDSGRAWALAFAMLLYLLLRYRFSKECSQEEVALGLECEKLRRRMVSNYAARAIRRALKTRTGATEVIGSFLNQLAHVEAKEAVAGAARRDSVSVFEFNPRHQGSGPWVVNGEVRVWWDQSEAPQGRQHEVGFEVAVPGRHRWPMRALSVWRTAIYSRGCIQILVPLVLGISALWICAWRVASHYL